jgi:hypothetical protein
MYWYMLTLANRFDATKNNMTSGCPAGCPDTYDPIYMPPQVYEALSY